MFQFFVGNTAMATPVASFTGTPLSGAQPLTVVFTDTSTNTPASWAWTFGDGGTSTLQNPTHTYLTPGTYTVALTATNASGSNTFTATGYVTVGLTLATGTWRAVARRDRQLHRRHARR